MFKLHPRGRVVAPYCEQYGQLHTRTVVGNRAPNPKRMIERALQRSNGLEWHTAQVPDTAQRMGEPERYFRVAHRCLAPFQRRSHVIILAVNSTAPCFLVLDWLLGAECQI